MAVQLPAASEIEKVLYPHCPDEKRREFVQWFAQRVGGNTFANLSAVETDLAFALDDYAMASHASQVVVNIYYELHFKDWTKALKDLINGKQ